MPTKAVLDAERGVILQSFGGSRAAYVNALRQAHASVSVARGIIGDELRRARVQATLPGGTPTARPDPDVLRVVSRICRCGSISRSPQPSWLGAKKQGFAISEVAPDRIFTSEGRPGGDAAHERRLVPDQAARRRAAARRGAAAQGDAGDRRSAAQLRPRQAFENWTVSKQRYVLNGAICARDDLPQPSAVDLTSYLPFLRLGASAAAW